MRDTQKIVIPADPPKPPKPEERENECWINVSASHISFRWDQPLPEEPHKVTRVELMVAAAMIGVARSLTGKGAEAVLDSLVKRGRG
jgi:hypothetical protein